MKDGAVVDKEITADQAKELLGVTTREAVVYMVKTGKLPGSHQLEPGKSNSPWLLRMMPKLVSTIATLGLSGP